MSRRTFNNENYAWSSKAQFAGIILLLLVVNTIYIIVSSQARSMTTQYFQDNNYELIFEDSDMKDDTMKDGIIPNPGAAAGDYPSPPDTDPLMQYSNVKLNCNSKLDDNKETAVLITSNWIPSAPKIDVIQEVIDSLSQLKGLSPSAPVFIVVDHLFPTHQNNGRHLIGKERINRERVLEEYSSNLMREYKNRPNFRVIVNKVNFHIGGNLKKTLTILDDDTKFLYCIQHDFKFIKEINHTAIVKAMKDYPQRLKNVRFNKKTNVSKRRGDLCWSEPDAELRVEGANFTKTSGWSDNNHFASVDFYKSLIGHVKSVNRPLEAPMQYNMYAYHNCSEWAQHLYGAPWQGRHIIHLDGRLGNRADMVKVVANVTQAANLTKATNLTS
jgi:hypothetical protein